MGIIQDREATRLLRDGEAEMLTPVSSFEEPSGPRVELEALRNEIRKLTMEENAMPFLAKVSGKEADGTFMILPNSYDRKDGTVDVLRAKDPKQVIRVQYNSCISLDPQ